MQVLMIKGSWRAGCDGCNDGVVDDFTFGIGPQGWLGFQIQRRGTKKDISHPGTECIKARNCTELHRTSR